MNTVTRYVLLAPLTIVLFLLWLSVALFLAVLRAIVEMMTCSSPQAKGKRQAREILLKF